MVTKERKVHHSLIAGLCLSVLVIALGVSRSSTASARPGPPGQATTNVNVVNPPTSPVPAAVTNTAANPVQTQNVGGGAATLVGQPASKLVNLFCSTSSPLGTCGFSVPTGEALVVTDWEWICISTIGQGNYDGPNLFANPGGNVLLSDSALVDGRQVVRGKDHLTSGVVAPAGSSPAVGSATNGCTAAVQGYLVPNQ